MGEAVQVGELETVAPCLIDGLFDPASSDSVRAAVVECEDEADGRIDRVLLATALSEHRDTSLDCLYAHREYRRERAGTLRRSEPSLVELELPGKGGGPIVPAVRGLEVSVPLVEEPERPAGTDELGAGLEPLEQLDGLNADLPCFAASPGTPENAGERAQGRPLAASISELPIAGDCCP